MKIKITIKKFSHLYLIGSLVFKNVYETTGPIGLQFSEIRWFVNIDAIKTSQTKNGVYILKRKAKTFKRILSKFLI